MATAVVTGTTGTYAAMPVELAALITPANSTAQIFAGSTYYGQNWAEPVTAYGPPQVVPFFLGPTGISNAIKTGAAGESGKERVVVLASGWGAGQTGTALAAMQASGDPALKNVDLVILDNNSNRPAGGFWSSFGVFAPLLGTSATPTPTNLGVRVIDVSYEYNINSSAPTYPGNVLADANSLMAYAYGYGGQATAVLPDDPESDDPSGLDPGYHYIVHTDGSFTKVKLDGESTTTYVTYESDGLPLVRPLRSLPGGGVVADAIEPTLTVLVNAGYKDNEPIPDDPSVARPGALMPSSEENAETIAALPGAVQQGATKAQKDLSTGTNILPKTSPLPTSLAGMAPGIPSLSLPSTAKGTTPLRSPIAFTGSKLVKPKSGPGTSGSGGGQLTGGVTKALSGVTDSLSKAVKSVTDKAPSAPTKPGGSASQ